MASSIERLAVALVLCLFGCSDLPSKSDALEIVKKDVKEDASCVLPAPIFTSLKMQLVTKAACVPKENAAATQTCVNALVSTGLVSAMPPSYMLEWPDDVASKSLGDVPAYERRARKDVYGSCFATSAEMREGRFKCGDAAADHVLKVTKVDEKHADVRYARKLTLDDAKLSELDKACGAITRPPVELTVKIEKAEKGWSLAPPDVAYH